MFRLVTQSSVHTSARYEQWLKEQEQCPVTTTVGLGRHFQLFENLSLLRRIKLGLHDYKRIVRIQYTE